MTFSIITPTIGRTSLTLTCDSIDKQPRGEDQIQHIIAYDGVEDEKFHIVNSLINQSRSVPEHLQNRAVIATGQRFNDFGHSVREFAYQFATGDYIGYLDDDDIYINDTFKELEKFIYGLHYFPEFIIFPCLRLGQVFYNIPARSQMTTSIQYIHKRVGYDGKPIKYTPGGYGHDGEWLDEMLKTYEFVYMPRYTKPLARVDYISEGKIL